MRGRFHMFEGHIDNCSVSKIRGWCRSTTTSDSVYVDIFINGKHVVKVLANIHRQDLELAGKGKGNHGFEYIIPNLLLDGSTFEIHVKYNDQDLIGSPRSLNTFVSGDGQSRRSMIATNHLSGSGIEIGALHNPLVVDGVQVKYVDRMNKKELQKFYNNIETNMVEVDIIDDGERLYKIENSSQDFIISNHMLEHCENPIGTIENHLTKLKKGGILFYSVPDKRFTFDVDRPLTTFEHLMVDYEGEIDNLEHYREWAKYYYKFEGEEIEIKAREFQDINHNIHFHVWDLYSFSNFLLNLKQVLDFEILHIEQNYNEIVTVLRK